MKISFLISHYNRPDSLKNCIGSILNLNLNKKKFEIVISDDNSDEVNLNKIKNYTFDRLISSKTNTGLASNLNRGIKKCEGEFIVYIQEDFIFLEESKSHILRSIEFIQNGKSEMIRFKSPNYFKKFKTIDSFKLIPRFSFKNFLFEHYRYSDNPYIVEKSFFEKYGLYKENVNTSYGECEYMVRMMKLNPKIATLSVNIVMHNDIEGSVREKNKIINRVTHLGRN